MSGVALNELFPSPLRYPGGKGKVANYLKLLLLRNQLVGGDYAEPYAGGASVALSLLFENYVDQIFINDVDRSIHAFWSAALTQTEDLCELIEQTDVSVEEWHRQRSIQDEESPDTLALAYSTLFLNRTSRSGIIRGGIVGGKDQKGRWKIDARYKAPELVRRIRRIGRYRSRIEASRLDAADFLQNTVPEMGAPLIYLDPPYYVKGGELYRNFYAPKDHEKIAGLVADLREPWVVSYDCVPEVQALYPSATSVVYDLRYSAQARYLGSEVMFFSSGLELPDVPSPSGVRPEVVGAARLAAVAGEE